MYKIVKRREFKPTVIMVDVLAPLVAAKAKPGQFIILRVDENSERIPLTIAKTDKTLGTVRIIFQVIGATTMKLKMIPEGGFIHDFVGPLGNPTHTEGIKKVCVIGGGVGCAIALPIAEAFHDLGANVTSIIGFRNKDLVILEDEFKAASDKFIIMSDDGSVGKKGNVTEPLRELLSSGEKFDMIMTLGPIIMMKFVTLTAKEFGAKVTVSMCPIMIDGTGMCGGCRVTLNRDGKKITKFACVDGPEFDGYEIDFDSALNRGKTYTDFEKHAYEKTCNLFKKEVK